MKVTRQQAIKIIDMATGHGDFDDWWPDMMDDFGLYDAKKDTFPNIYDVFEALGVSKEECLESKTDNPDEQDDSELKPCPFCGGKAELVIDSNSIDVCCTSVGCYSKIRCVSTSKKDAINKWNERKN